MRTIVPLLAIAISFLTPSFADDAKQVFESLYGPRIKAAKASVDRADDHALAKELLTSAGSSTDTPALLALMCEASYDLSSKHADGFATAAQAMTLLAESVEAQRTGAREKLVDVLMKQSRLGKADEREAAGEQLIDTLLVMGDEKMEVKQWSDATGDYRRAMTIAAPKKSAKLETVKAKLELAMRRDRAEKQIARLSEKLLADANDSATAEEIVKLYVVEFDDPKSALPFLNRVKDENLKKLVPLAAGTAQPSDGVEWLALGEWYRSLAGSTPNDSQVGLLEHAAEALKTYSRSDATSLNGKKAVLLLEDVERHLARLSASRPTKVSSGTGQSNTWVDVLPMIDAARDRRWGNWRVEKNALVLNTQDGWNVLNTPAKLDGGYDIRCKFTRDSGGDAVMFKLPVKDKAVELVLSGAGGVAHSLHRSTDDAKRQNDLVKPGTLNNGQSYLLEISLRLTGNQASIQVALDGKKLLGWVETLEAINAQPFVKSSSPSTVNLATYGADLTIHQLEIRPVNGKVSIIKDDKR